MSVVACIYIYLNVSIVYQWSKLTDLLTDFFAPKEKKKNGERKRFPVIALNSFFFNCAHVFWNQFLFIISVLFACIVSMQLVISGRWWWVTLEERNYSVYACVEVVFPLTISDFLDRVVTLFIACEQRNRKATPKPQGRIILEIKIGR